MPVKIELTLTLRSDTEDDAICKKILDNVANTLSEEFSKRNHLEQALGKKYPNMSINMTSTEWVEISEKEMEETFNGIMENTPDDPF